jgi:rhodanese-related sulfurtransferase
MPRRTGILPLALIVGLACLATAAEHTKDSLATIKQNIEDEKAVLVDVRDKDEWEAGHIEGAIFLPLASIEDGLSQDELKSLPKDKVLYVHCVVGARALKGANALEKEGFKVKPMKPGYKELIDAGFPKAK